jgi:hypothetical protein
VLCGDFAVLDPFILLKSEGVRREPLLDINSNVVIIDNNIDDLARSLKMTFFVIPRENGNLFFSIG